MESQNTDISGSAEEASGPAAIAEKSRWWGFWTYAAVALIHVAAIVFGLDDIVYPTKLALMPLLALAALWYFGGTGPIRHPAATRLLFLALAFSWLGDGASFFFPMFDDELPAMLLCFGIAHLLYIWLFARHMRTRPIPAWTLVYGLWWGVMIAVLWPHLGALLVPVILYGLILGGTAVASTRGGVLTTIGGAFFLASDTILALRLFLPDVPGDLTSPWIMLTYTLGQGLLALGITRVLQGRTSVRLEAPA